MATKDLRYCINKPIPMPVGMAASQRDSITPYYSHEKVNSPFGFPRSFTVPKRNGGTALTLPAMNAFAYGGTVGSFLHQIGFKPTFDKQISDQIGGYPIGAVLWDYSRMDEDSDSECAVVREVVSLQPNNTKNFVYDDFSNPNPYVIGSEVDGVVWWDYVGQEEADYSLMAPDYTSKKLVVSIKNVTNSDTGVLTWVSNFEGWFLIEISAEKGYVCAFPPESEKINSVFYYGYSPSSDSWNGAIGTEVEDYRVYNTRMPPKFSFVVPTNAGIVHQIKTIIEDEENPLNIEVYGLGVIDKPSGDDDDSDSVGEEA